MFRINTIFLVSILILSSLAIAQQTVKIGDFEVALGGNIRALYTSYMHIRDYYGEHYVNDQAVFPDVARLSLSGKYGEHLNAYFEGGYFNGWNYEHNWEEGYYFVRTTEWFYLGYMDLNLGMFGVSGGLNFVPTGIEPTTRDVDLHFLKPSVATLLLTPMRKPGIDFRFTPFRFGERDFMSLSFGLYDNIYPLLDQDNQFDGFDRRFLLDLPYMASLTMNPLKPIKITGYYGREIAWQDINNNKNWDENDDYTLILCGAGASVNMLGISANMDFFYRHRIEGFWLNEASSGGQVSVFYKMPSFGFITLEPAFRVDIYNPVKHEKYDKVTTYTYGLNMYAFDDHIRVMMNYYHPMEEISKYMTQTPNDEMYAGLQLTM